MVVFSFNQIDDFQYDLILGYLFSSKRYPYIVKKLFSLLNMTDTLRNLFENKNEQRLLVEKQSEPISKDRKDEQIKSRIRK